MEKIYMNDAIISYVEFIEKIVNHHEDHNLFIQFETFYNLYIQYKTEVKSLITFQGNTIFYFTKVEQVWAYLHLLIETLEKKDINIIQENNFKNLSSLSAGLGKIWVSNTNNIEQYICLDIKAANKENIDISN